ncbi:MAG: hypothetical protein IKJ36_02190 [Clostridia bacterium]|nr:hypothetical protein [Clostridia bacterium]
MIYLQHGPMWKPKTEDLLDKQLVNGIIWDPREENIERINMVRKENSNYNRISNVVDLKWFYKQFPNSTMKNLESLDYFPDTIIDRNYFRDIEEVKSKVKKMVEFQEKMNVTEFLSPSLYMASFNERIIDRLFDVDDLFYEFVKKSGKEIILSLIIHESAFDNDTYMKEFIDDISNYIGKYTGVYLVIDRDNSSTIRHSFSETRLANVLKFIYSFKKMKFKVIMGYTGIESINYMAVGADIIATGWFYSLRRFNRLEKGLEEYSNMGRAKKRYLSLNLLSELTIDDNIQSIPSEQKSELYKLIFNGNSLDEEIKTQAYELIPMKNTFIQYFEGMNELNSKFDEIEEVEDKLFELENMINNAIKNVDIYNEKRQGIGSITKKHLLDYLNAIKKFKEENYI